MYECTTDDQIMDLLRGGQGVFGIDIGHTTADVAAAVVDLPSVPTTETVAAAANERGHAAMVVDELAARGVAGRRSA